MNHGYIDDEFGDLGGVADLGYLDDLDDLDDLDSEDAPAPSSSKLQVTFAPDPLHTIHEAGEVGGSGLSEDIGMFDDPGPLPSRSTASAPAPFTVPKPGLKSARKTASRGKGVPSSVLAADGTVTQQQASML